MRLYLSKHQKASLFLILVFFFSCGDWTGGTVVFWFWNHEWNSSFLFWGGNGNGPWFCCVGFFIILIIIYFGGTFGKCAADQWELKLGGWEHPDLNIDLTHKAEQVRQLPALQPAETLSVCTYDTIFLSDPSAPQLQPPRAASCPLYDPYVYAWLFIGKREKRDGHCISETLVWRQAKKENGHLPRWTLFLCNWKKVYENVKKWERGHKKKQPEH